MDLILQVRGNERLALETHLGLIICHRRIPEKSVCLAAVTSEQ